MEEMLRFILGQPAGIVTLGFALALFVVFIEIMMRYRRLNRTLDDYLQVTDALIAYIEHQQPPETPNKNILDNFNDYRAVLRDSKDEGDCFIKFKRKNLAMLKNVVPHIEFCRTWTESLPFIGILGTVLGFLLTPGMMDGGFNMTTSGLVLALASTATALCFAIIVKIGFESNATSRYLHFESTLQALESYGERHGVMEKAAIKTA